jgi:hypothetical protein
MSAPDIAVRRRDEGRPALRAARPSARDQTARHSVMKDDLVTVTCAAVAASAGPARLRVPLRLPRSVVRDSPAIRRRATRSSRSRKARTSWCTKRSTCRRARAHRGPRSASTSWTATRPSRTRAASRRAPASVRCPVALRAVGETPVTDDQWPAPRADDVCGEDCGGKGSVRGVADSCRLSLRYRLRHRLSANDTLAIADSRQPTAAADSDRPTADSRQRQPTPTADSDSRQRSVC